MAKLWFQNSNGNERIIANCETMEEVFIEIQKFIDECNRKWPKKNPFKIYYTRVWEEDGMTKLDVGSHTEFFYWEGEYQYDSESSSKSEDVE